MNPQTDFLISDMNFWTGAGSVFNLAGNLYQFNNSASPEEADYQAVLSDWSMVGIDLQNAINEYEANNG